MTLNRFCRHCLLPALREGSVMEPNPSYSEFLYRLSRAILASENIVNDPEVANWSRIVRDHPANPDNRRKPTEEQDNEWKRATGRGSQV